MEPPPSAEAHEVMAPLFIPGWPKADHTKGASSHVVGVLLMRLSITTEFKTDVFAVVEVPPSEKLPGRQCGRHPIRVRECVEPEHCVGHQTHDDKTG